MKNAFMKLYYIGIIVSLVCLAAPKDAHSATYNFYFNNTEQGDNSTATPNVTINDGKAPKKQEQKPEVKSEDLPEQYPADEPAVVSPEATPVPSRPTSTAAARLESRRSFERDHPHWRFIGGAFAAHSEGNETIERSVFDDDWDPFNSSYSERRSRSGGGVLLTGTYFFTPIIGATVFLGSAAGTEFELTPLHLLNDTIELGAMVGVTAINYDLIDKASAHVGARLGLNFGRNWGISVAGRMTPYPNEDFQFQMIEAGLTFRI